MSEIKNILTPMKAIRAKCLDCCCGQYKEVELCPCEDCPLYIYRFGKNPNIKLTDEQKAAKVANLKRKPTQPGEKAPVPLQPGTDTPRPTETRKAVAER